MKTKLISFITGLLLTSDLFAQTSLPYVSGFDNEDEQTGWQQIRKGDNGLYEWEYDDIMPYSGTEALIHNYPVGGSSPTDDWFISPAFDFSAGGQIDSLRYSFSGFGAPGDGDTVAIYLLTGDPDPAMAESILLLHDFRGAGYTGDGNWHITGDIEIPATAGNSYIAFRYTTTANWLDVKFDNIGLSSNAPPTGIDPVSKAKPVIRLYPNPNTGLINIISKETISEVIVTGISGKIYCRLPYTRQIDLSALENGWYIISCVTAKGAVVALKSIKI